MRKILIILFSLLSCQSFGQVQAFILKNGLKILVKEDHRAPVAVSMVWYHVGSADEPGGLTGMSHALEHMMFKGTQHYPLGVFSKRIAAKGGQHNAMTHYDYTVFYEKIAASQLATAFELEADRMHNLEFNASEFAKEIKVIQEERRLRTDDNPKALTLERFLATAHLSAPYNHPVIGWMSDLQQMDIAALKQWYLSHYLPNNATLVVVGDVNPEKIHTLAEHYFGAIPAKPIQTSISQIEPPALGKKSLFVNTPAQLPLLVMGYSVPSVKSAKHPWEAYALELIAGILDASEGSRLTHHLINETHVASSVTTMYNLYSKYPTQFILMATPSQTHTVKDLQNSLLTEITALKNTPVSEKELQRVKNQIIAQKTFENDSIFSQAMELGLLETIGLGWQHAQEFNQAILAITAEQIQHTAQHYFQQQNTTLAQLKPILSAETRSSVEFPRLDEKSTLKTRSSSENKS